MPYITNIELDGMVKNARESSVAALEVRFGTVPAEISERLGTIDNIDVLKQLHRQAVVIGSVEEFQQLLNEVPTSEPTKE